MLQVKVGSADEALKRELDLLRADEQSLKALQSTHCRSFAVQKEIDMLKRLLEEEAASLSVLEKSLDSQVRFGEVNMKALEDLRKRVSEEDATRARVLAENRRLEALCSKETLHARDLKVRVRDQLNQERITFEHLATRETALQRARDDLQFCERTRKCELDNIMRMERWMERATKEQLHLSEMCKRCGLADASLASQPISSGASAEPPRQTPLLSLRRETAELMHQVVVSARLLEEKYRH